MANTYSQISIQVVFATKFRECNLSKEWRDDLWKYITGILKNERCTVLAVNGWVDHVHVFFGMPTDRSIADVVRSIKANSSRWINEKKFTVAKFAWQEGYGAFSYSRSQRHRVIRYINNQERHHMNHSFREEYLDMLEKAEVRYDSKYVFEFFESRNAA